MSKRVSFDLDGTILDSQLSVQNAMLESLTEIDINIKYVPSNGETLDHLISKLGFVDKVRFNQVKDRFKDLYDLKYCLNANIYPGILTLLKKLHLDGYMLNLITNKRERPTKKIIQHFRIQSYFENICCIDTLNNRRNKQKMLDEYFDNDHKNIYIGDLYEDYLAANSTGYIFYHVSWGYGKESNEYQTYKNVTELYDAIKNA